MNRLIPLTSALVLALGAGGVAFAEKDKDNGGGKGKPEQQARGGHQGHGNGKGREDRGGPGKDRVERKAKVRGPDGPGVVIVQHDRKDGRDARARDLGRRDVGPGDPRGLVVDRRSADRGLMQGCPPGLAKKNNGCLPPGQARKIDERDDYARYNYLWRTRGDDLGYRYRDGYLYRVDRQGAMLGYLPVLGGVLSRGNAWPGQYEFQPAPSYYSQYYDLNDRYQYRYADGVLYGVDPQTQAISRIAALLTGQQINVGQRMPAGYDVYNVPYDYRDRYPDSAQSRYRYNDGYIYQVDPTTQLVQAVIQLLT